MADLFLNFIRASQIGGWALHLQSAVEIVPCCFVYDHLNYASYLPVDIYGMLVFPDTNPSIAEHLAAGDVLVQKKKKKNGTSLVRHQ